MTKKKITSILKLLDMHYPWDDKCFLNYKKDYELLFATILSAQCTDAQVNRVTEKLFEKYKTLEEFAAASLEEMEQAVKTTGFYHNKAKNIILSARILLERHGGIMPSDIESLTRLPGVGRKTANIMLSHVFRTPSVVVDTHVGRVSRRLGFTAHNDPTRVEFELMKILPKDHWIRFNSQIITLGREICRARGPKCESCFLNKECEAYNKSGFVQK